MNKIGIIQKMNFERFAKNYQNEAVVQKEIAKQLALKIKKADSILDLGSGNGALFSSLQTKPNKFFALDMSKNMLSLHPKTDGVFLINDSFDNKNFWQEVENVDLIASCGALQWSNDIELLIKNISTKTQNIALAIFTNKTLASIRNITGQETFLPSYENLTLTCSRYFNSANCEKISYRLYFNNKSKMFKHLKLTGVHFGNRLDFTLAKKLYQEYKLDYLEFEVFIVFN